MTVELSKNVGVVSRADMTGLTGLAFFQEVMAGRFPAPPLAGQIPMRIIEADVGRVVWETSPPDWFVNPLGQIHGGYVMTLIDSACGCAVHSALAAGTGYTTIETKVNMSRPLRADAMPLRAVGTTITVGRRVATSEAKIFDAEDRVVAFGTSTCLVFDL